MQDYHYGELTLNKKPTAEVAEYINTTLGDDSICEVGETILVFEEYYSNYLEENLGKIIEYIAPFGYVINGEIESFGEDGDGKICVEDNQVDSCDNEDSGLRDATDAELIEILEERGYIVTKKAAVG